MPRNLPGDRLHTQGIRGVQHGFDHATITTIALIYNAGAVVGGIRFGALSERIGRRVTSVMAALLSLPVLPFWHLAAPRSLSGSPAS